MWLRPFLILPLLTLTTAIPDEGCGSGEPTPTPTPDITPTPGPVDSDYQRFLNYLDEMEDAGTFDEKEALTQAFFYDIAYSGGFPIQSGNQITFVYTPGEVSGTVRVTGDFNDWDADEFILEELSDFPLYYKTIEIPNVEGSRMLYKFVGRSGGSDTYIADPHARRLQWDEFGQYSLLSGGPNQSHLERYPTYMSEALGNGREIMVYVPRGYYGSPYTYPTLYMHDGQNLFDPNAYWGGWGVDDVADEMINQGNLEPMLIVGLANTFDRMDEYTHVEEFLPAYGGVMGGDGDLYADFLVHEIMPFIADRYRTSPAKADTGVLGSSLGGLISYYIGATYPDTFQYVGGMSSTFGWGKINLDNETVIELLATTPKTDQVYYLDSGGGAVGSCEDDSDGDGIWDDNGSASDNYCETLQMRQVLLEKGYNEGVDLFYEWAPGAEHNEAEWHKRMDEALSAFSNRN